MTRFIDYKDRVAQTFLVLNLSRNLAPRVEEVEEGEVAKREATRVDKVATNISRLEATTVGDPEEVVTATLEA